MEPVPKRPNRILWCIAILLVVAIGGLVFIAVRQNYAGKLGNLLPRSEKTLPGYYRVVKVYDGDTIEIDMNGVLEKVRFIGVDTPETHDPNEPVGCYGPEASAFTTSQLSDQQVRLEVDPTNQNRDRYGRLLRYIYLPDGTLYNKELISQGYGAAYTAFPFLKTKEFLSAESSAKSQNIGLWGSCTVTYPRGQPKTNAL